MSNQVEISQKSTHFYFRPAGITLIWSSPTLQSTKIDIFCIVILIHFSCCSEKRYQHQVSIFCSLRNSLPACYCRQQLEDDSVQLRCGTLGLVGSGLPASAKRIFPQQQTFSGPTDLQLQGGNLDPSEGPRMTGGASNMDGAAGTESQAAVFHLRCGQLVSLSQAGRTASRSHATQV